MATDSPEFHPADRFRGIFNTPERVRASVREFIGKPDRPLTRTYLPPTIDLKADQTTTTDASSGMPSSRARWHVSSTAPMNRSARGFTQWRLKP